MERQLCTLMSVWQQGYHNNVCHVVWMFWLTLGRSLHFFLVLLLLIFNIKFNCECYLMSYLCGKPKRGYGVFFRDICLYVVMTTSFLIFIILYWDKLLKIINNSCIFFILLYFIVDFKQLFTMFYSFNLNIETVF